MNTSVHKPPRKLWMSFGIEGIRETEGSFSTYEGFDNEIAPPLPTREFDGSLRWLKTHGTLDSEFHDTYGYDEQSDDWTKALEKITREAESLGIALPRAYCTLMGNHELRNFFRSPTACFFSLTDESITPLGDRPGEYLLRFYNDQQGCCFWYLHFANGECRVVMSEFDFEPGYDLSEYLQYLEVDEDSRHEGSWYALWECAPDCESFLYRVWIESEIWYKGAEGDFTPREKEYVDFFLNGQAAS